ncbi:DHH family phosphoesterase [Speluncibacter jeojiensis]|uniref:Bifunctional oligoribonuclease/PAP phosphatase NrnA n=1 Tax=Speluncibacter jeojiensis TaxID=2710754 RepID=A0A9X4M0A4_9ACTN|nr:bifunctional oligoribonuclease/PAP phosphatase NrnA [Rhodococcus sp. D2-41]MDG3013917.1 bifunctional oligoribonuclease/PAP phosphatase NrnA [Corynebacteriales bacterium D3-21]
MQSAPGAPIGGTGTEHGIDEAVALLAAATSVTVLCHVHPDADTIGSGLALAIALARRSIPVQVSFPHPHELPESLRSMPGVEHLVAPEQVAAEVDLLVTVDAGSPDRVGDLAGRMAGARRTLVIDHHATNTRFGMVNVVDVDAESTTVVIAQILQAWGVPIDAALAHCLYAGLVTDTGSFKWAGARSHRLAADLLDTGIDGAAISRTLLDTHPFGWLPMLSAVLGTARLEPDSAGGLGLVHAVIRRADVGSLRWEEVESVVDIVRTTADAEVAAVLKEQPDGRWSVSLRSKRAFDVAQAARTLGGGGHRFAAGFTAEGEPDEVLSSLRRALG